MRRAARVDGPHAAVVKALDRIGAFVVDLSGVGRGVPDLLVGWREAWLLIEVKPDVGESRRRNLRPGAQADFHAIAAGRRLPCYVVRSSTEAVSLLAGIGVRAAS